MVKSLIKDTYAAIQLGYRLIELPSYVQFYRVKNIPLSYYDLYVVIPPAIFVAGYTVF